MGKGKKSQNSFFPLKTKFTLIRLTISYPEVPKNHTKYKQKDLGEKKYDCLIWKQICFKKLPRSAL